MNSVALLVGSLLAAIVLMTVTVILPAGMTIDPVLIALLSVGATVVVGSIFQDVTSL